MEIRKLQTYTKLHTQAFLIQFTKIPKDLSSCEVCVNNSVVIKYSRRSKFDILRPPHLLVENLKTVINYNNKSLTPTQM